MDDLFEGLEPSHGPEFSRKLEAWRTWHKANPHVWKLFCREADRLTNIGAQNSSAWLVVNQLRWLHFFETKGDDFKIPNDHIAFYARAYMRSEPHRRGVFRIKRMSDEDFNWTQKETGHAEKA